MPIESKPANPLPENYVPPSGTAYPVADTDDWDSVARKFHVEVGTLIEFNFKTRNPQEVNWYLRRNVGCTRPTRDGKNWMFAGAKRGIVYIPPTNVQQAAPSTSTTITHSVATTSWIDQRLFDPKNLPEVDRYTSTPDRISRDVLTANLGYRFANYLEAYIVVNERGEIIKQDFTDNSGMYFGPSYKGIMPKEFPVIPRIEKSSDGKSVRFTQIVGAQTMSPQTNGSRQAVKTTDGVFGIHPNWGGPIGVQLENLASGIGVRVAENFIVFPPIWTELELTILSDGTFEGKLVRHSLFPSNSFYEQSYTVENIRSDSLKYELIQTYDARSKIDDWRKNGWGGVGGASGPAGGNPWVVKDPRILGRDLPFRPSPPSD